MPTRITSAPNTDPQRLPALQRGIYFSVASMALWMWLLHPSMSFLAIICCAASTSLVAVVLASRWFAQPLPSRISEACRRAFVTAFTKVRKEFDLLLGHTPVVSLTAAENCAGQPGHSPGQLEPISPQSEERD